MTYEFVDGGITRDVVGQDATRYTPFLGSLFLFILFCNFWEVIPFIQFPPTARFALPFYLAIQTYIIYLVVGFKHHGLKYLTGHLFPPGVPKSSSTSSSRRSSSCSCSSCGRSRWQSDFSPT